MTLKRTQRQNVQVTRDIIIRHRVIYDHEVTLIYEYFAMSSIGNKTKYILVYMRR